MLHHVTYTIKFQVFEASSIQQNTVKLIAEIMNVDIKIKQTEEREAQSQSAYLRAWHMMVDDAEYK